MISRILRWLNPYRPLHRHMADTLRRAEVRRG